MLDSLIVGFDRGLRTVCGRAPSARPMPGEGFPDSSLSNAERRHAAALMRVNHVGEICAQALYQGQSLTSRNPELRQRLAGAAAEELDHLAWTASRIEALGGRKSVLNPLLYAGALALGSAAGLLDDRWNLGFLAETERQVEAHLDRHLDMLPVGDEPSRAVLDQMRTDESAHAAMAESLGAAALPRPARLAMRAAARVMTTTAYYL